MMGISDPIKNGIFDLVWIKGLPMLYYSIQFSTMNSFDRSEIVIHNIDLIQYQSSGCNSSLWIYRSQIFHLYGIRSRVIAKQKKEDYGSQYSRTYCYCTVHSSSYCFFTYHLCKNSQPKWLICTKLELFVLFNDSRNEKKRIQTLSLKWNEWAGIRSILVSIY